MPTARCLLFDLDRLAIPGAVGARIGLVEPADPEVDDRPHAQELLAARVPEVLAGLGRHDARHQAAATLANPRRALEPLEARLELGHAFGVGRRDRADGRRARRGGPPWFGHRRPPSRPAFAGASNMIRSVPLSIFAPFVAAPTRARGSSSVRRHPAAWSTSSSDRRDRRTSSRSAKGSSTWSTYVPF